MAQSKKIIQIASVEKLEYIQQVINNISPSRIEAAITSVTNIKDVNNLLQIFSDMNNVIAVESDDLEEKAIRYNEMYATDINGRYSAAYNALSCIKKQIFALYALFTMDAKNKSKKRGYPAKNRRSLEYKINHSILGTIPFSHPIFDNKTAVQIRLIRETKMFLDYLSENIRICLNVITEERRIGDNEEELELRFNRQIEEIYNIVKKDKKKSNSTDATYYQDLLSIKNNPEMMKKWWHKLTTSEFVDVAWGIKNENLKQYTPLERKTFKENIGLLEKFRIVVSHIDEMGKLTGQILFFCFKYLGFCASQHKFLACFSETYKYLGGTQKIVTYSQFNQTCTAQLQVKFSSLEYLRFQQRMDGYC